MQSEPAISPERIVALLRNAYGLRDPRAVFLPIGADEGSASYRVVASNGDRYFLKLRRGVFNEAVVTLPALLSEVGITQIIAPVATRSGELCTGMDRFTAVLYPFIEGRDGFETPLSARQWAAFGAAVKAIHATTLPAPLQQRIPRETFTPKWRRLLMDHLTRLDDGDFADPIAAETADFLRSRRAETAELVERTERLALALQAAAPEFVLCHSDLHAGNLLITPGDAFFIVDWDDAVLAPKERDLMFIGGSQGFVECTALEEETLFYRGYGETQPDPAALAYYRYERIVLDIAVECEQIFMATTGSADRAQALLWMKSNFEPGGTLAAAHRAMASAGG